MTGEIQKRSKNIVKQKRRNLIQNKQLLNKNNINKYQHRSQQQLHKRENFDFSADKIKLCKKFITIITKIVKIPINIYSNKLLGLYRNEIIEMKPFT